MIPIKHICRPLVFILAGIFLLEGVSAQAVTLIDTFEDVSDIDNEQAVRRGGTGTIISINEQPGTTTGPGFANIIGGYRDLWLQAPTGTTTSSTRTAVGSVSGGVLSFANGPNVQSWLNVTWDGNDPGANSGNPTDLGTLANPGTFANTANDLRQVRRNGLGVQDYTDGNRLDSMAVEVLSADLGLQIQMTVYDTNGTGISTASYTFNQGVSETTPVYFLFTPSAVNAVQTYAPNIPYAVFAPLGTAPNARFTNVGAINLTLKATRTDVDAQVDLLRPVNARIALSIPEPSISLLAFSGVIASALLTLKKTGRSIK